MDKQATVRKRSKALKICYVQFHFGAGYVIFTPKVHEYNGKKYSHIVTVVYNGEQGSWHSNRTPNKKNAMLYINDLKNER